MILHDWPITIKHEDGREEKRPLGKCSTEEVGLYIGRLEPDDQKAFLFFLLGFALGQERRFQELQNRITNALS